MTSRECLIKTINHQQPEHVVLDLGSSYTTGISAFALKRLRRYLGLDDTVKILEPFEWLGLVDDDLVKRLNIDVVGIRQPITHFGYINEDWKPITVNNEEFYVGGKCAISESEDGTYYMYPQGDLDAEPSAKMPKGGFYFDGIPRESFFDEETSVGREDFKNDFTVLNDDFVNRISLDAENYFNNTEYGINLGCYYASLSDAAVIPGMSQKNPQGIRTVEDWLAAHILYPDYVKDVLDYHAECAMGSLKKLAEKVGDKAQVVEISAADFGTQRSEFIPPQMYRDFYQPIHAKINEWVHQNTKWKVMYHTCGSVVNLLDDFVDAGIDILNPVQCSAKGMDPEMLKTKYGDKFVFWGGGINTQQTLPFGTPEEVYREATERLSIFAPGGGFVFSAIHDIQADAPVENIMAMFKAVWDYNEKQ